MFKIKMTLTVFLLLLLYIFRDRLIYIGLFTSGILVTLIILGLIYDLFMSDKYVIRLWVRTDSRTIGGGEEIYATHFFWQPNKKLAIEKEILDEGCATAYTHWITLFKREVYGIVRNN